MNALKISSRVPHLIELLVLKFLSLICLLTIILDFTAATFHIFQFLLTKPLLVNSGSGVSLTDPLAILEFIPVLSSDKVGWLSLSKHPSRQRRGS